MGDFMHESQKRQDNPYAFQVAKFLEVWLTSRIKGANEVSHVSRCVLYK